jgi:hypothetical protein
VTSARPEGAEKGLLEIYVFTGQKLGCGELDRYDLFNPDRAGERQQGIRLIADPES